MKGSTGITTFGHTYDHNRKKVKRIERNNQNQIKKCIHNSPDGIGGGRRFDGFSRSPVVTATVIHVLQNFPTDGKVMRMVSHLRLKRLVGVLTAISLHVGPDMRFVCLLLTCCLRYSNRHWRVSRLFTGRYRRPAGQMSNSLPPDETCSLFSLYTQSSVRVSESRKKGEEIEERTWAPLLPPPRGLPAHRPSRIDSNRARIGKKVASPMAAWLFW